jgi:hypothetical protein
MTQLSPYAMVFVVITFAGMIYDSYRKGRSQTAIAGLALCLVASMMLLIGAAIDPLTGISEPFTYVSIPVSQTLFAVPVSPSLFVASAAIVLSVVGAVLFWMDDNHNGKNSPS